MKENKANDINSEDINNLLSTVKQLRSPIHGCPWNQIQTHESLLPYIIEEANEVCFAIVEKDQSRIKEELGDLLFQIIFHADIAAEKGEFNFNDIAKGLNEKLKRRHPHIFQNKQSTTIEVVEKSWKVIKLSEKNHKITESDLLKEKIRSQSPVDGAITIANQAYKYKPSWKNISHIWEKINEEIAEIQVAEAKEEMDEIGKEIGDLLFCIINLANYYKFNPSELISENNQKFLARLNYIEENLGDIEESKQRDMIENLSEESKQNNDE
tara:strand:- start:23515 stop:24321 length:807 start_codon:yes stop_codon:yes gene_type:complete